MLTKTISLTSARFLLAFILVLAAFGSQPITPVAAATFTITNTNDSGPGSLRQAIADAIAGDSIVFDSSLAGKTIILASTLVIDKNLTIDGSSLASKIVISGNNSVIVFLIPSPATVTLGSLVITKGYSLEDSGGIYNDGILSLLHSDVVGNSGPSGAGIGNGGTVNLINSNISTNVGKFGGGVDNRGSLNITDSTVSGNTADQGAGIMNSYGSVTVVNSTFSGNRSTVTAGGAIQNDAGTLNISGSTFSDNVATTEGGAIYNNFGVAMDVANSTFSRNSALFGGGIMNVQQSSSTLTNTTFWSNYAFESGGGIANEAGSHSTLRNVTFNANRVRLGNGGGIYNGISSNSLIINSILYGDTAGEIYNASGSASVTYSIVQGEYTGTGNQDADPLFGPLQDNGGPTQTMALLSGSPAINAGNDTDCPSTDARGVGRLQGPHCDIGAYEFVPAAPVTLTVTKIEDTNDGVCNADCSLREAVANSYNGDTIQFAVSGTIVLTSNLPAINKTLVVDGSGQAVKLDGAGSHQFFRVLEVGSLTLKNLTLQNGHASPCPDDATATCGGAIYNDGKLNVINSTFSGNSADSGGAIYGWLGTSNIEGSTFTGNSATRYGGGIFNVVGTVNVTNSTFYGNSASLDGGAILNNLGDLTLTNSTFSDNSAGRGAGVYNRSGGLAITNNIMANSITGSDCYNEYPWGEVYLNVNNLIEANAAAPNNCGTPSLVSDPNLGPLANNGGPTQTMALLSGSPAIDAGADASCPGTDQRGIKRPQGSHCDMGAYEDYKNKDTVGVFRPSNGLIYLKYTNETGYADLAINYGIGGDYPIAGDWDGDGVATIGVYRNGYFYLRNSNTVGYADWVFPFGTPGDQPVAGDWNGDGIDTIGVYNSKTITFYLRDSNTSGPADYVFRLGIPGDIGIAGDWTGKGYDSAGVFRPSNGVIFLKNTNDTGYADIAINYGQGGDKPVTGDWDGNGTDTIGVLRGNTFYLRNSNTVGYADKYFALGVPGDMPIAGTWKTTP